MDHLKNHVCKLHHCFGDILDDFLDRNEERIIQDLVILLQHGHQDRNQHWHERH